MEIIVDKNTTAWLTQQIAQWWLNIRLDTISACTSFFVGALSAGDPNYIAPEYLAISLQQAFGLTNYMKMVR